MHIKELFLNGFRNLVNRRIDFDSQTNLIFGPNGIGKTSVLEAIHFIAFGKSFLDAKRDEMANIELSSFYIFSVVENQLGINSLAAFFREDSFFSINEQKSSVLNHIKIIYPVVFSSGTYIGLVDHRMPFRKVVDRFIYGVDNIYLHYILRYNKILKHKSTLLKTKKTRADDKELDSWNLNFSEMGTYINKKRLNFVNQLNKILIENFDKSAQIKYHPSLNVRGDCTEYNFFSHISKFKDIEKKIGRCIMGPHRDYYEILINNRIISSFSSGEKKKYLLMIYLAYIELYFQFKNEYPIFLIDDFDSALDHDNYKKIIEIFPPLQVIATSVNKKGSFNHFIRFKKEN